MRRVLERRLPHVRALAGTAEAIPLADGVRRRGVRRRGVPLVRPAARASAEIARVLRPGGGLVAAVEQARLGRASQWIDELEAIVASATTGTSRAFRAASPWREALDADGRFEPLARRGGDATSRHRPRGADRQDRLVQLHRRPARRPPGGRARGVPRGARAPRRRHGHADVQDADHDHAADRWLSCARPPPARCSARSPRRPPTDVRAAVDAAAVIQPLWAAVPAGRASALPAARGAGGAGRHRQARRAAGARDRATAHRGAAGRAAADGQPPWTRWSRTARRRSPTAGWAARPRCGPGAAPCSCRPRSGSSACARAAPRRGPSRCWRRRRRCWPATPSCSCRPRRSPRSGSRPRSSARACRET